MRTSEDYEKTISELKRERMVYEKQYHGLLDEISQLKKQLEEKEDMLNTYKAGLIRKTHEVLELKSKLEVKEKPDLTAEQYFNENYSGTATSEFLRPFIINSYNHGRQSRDAAIAERDKEIDRLKQSRIESIKASLEKGYRTGDFSDNSIVIVE